MKTQRSILLAVIFICTFVFIGGVIVVVSFMLQSGGEGGIEPTLASMLTANAISDAVGTGVAEAITLKPTTSSVETPDTIPTLIAIPTESILAEDGFFLYQTIPGDTINAILARFDTSIEHVQVSGNFSKYSFLPAGTDILIPIPSFESGPALTLFPDSMIVYGLADVDFNVRDFVNQAGGYLSDYQGDARGDWLDGAAIVERVALEHSISTKLLLALLEFRSGWVYGNTDAMRKQVYPIGFHATDADGLYEELYISARLLGYGYYGWRDGTSLTLHFPDGETLRLHPGINAGTAALENLFAGLEKKPVWEDQLFSKNSFTQTYQEMFGDFKIKVNEQQILDWLTQPPLDLPFPQGENYHLTSGPHRAWGLGSPWAAVDFAPADGLKGCIVSPFWVTASASGYVVRAEKGVVVIDLDGDGWEQTGWVLFYLHLAEKDRIHSGIRVNAGDRIGHASCEGGVATGSHVHFARKFNGEWMPAGGAIPMNLSGWVVENGKSEYQGQMVRDLRIVFAYPYSTAASVIAHD